MVELFGHQRLAGRITEQTIGGQSFVRVDVPEVRIERHGSGQLIIAAHTKSFGAGAIYAISWCDERAARAAAQSIRHEPISVFALKDALRTMSDTDRQRMLAAPVVEIEGNDGGDGDDDQPY